MGLGCIPADHPLCMGNIGMHGGYETGMATDKCDLIIACGARFSDRVAGDRDKFGAQAEIVQLEIDEKERFNFDSSYYCNCHCHVYYNESDAVR